MVASVTGRGRNGRAHLVAGRRSPSSHVLTKAVGDTISASWGVRNTGGVAGFGHLEFVFPSPGPGFYDVGPSISIPAGATVTLTISSLITIPLVAGQIYAGELRVEALAPATVGPGGVHPFTLNISPDIPAPRFAVGDQVTWRPFPLRAYCGTILRVLGFFTDHWEYEVTFTHPTIAPVATLQEFVMTPGWDADCLR